MPALNTIVQDINSSLKANSFASRRFQDAKYFGIAYLISSTDNEGKVTSAMTVDNFGEGTDVTPDDVTPIQFYHRNISLNYLDDQIESFGDAGKNVTEVAEMILVCFGDRSKLRVTQEDVAAAIWLDIPRNPSVQYLQKVIIEPGDVNVKPEEVWAQEFDGVEYALSTKDFMLSVKYKITSVYTKCLALCN